MIEDLRETPLNGVHRSLGARMVGFAGFELPLHYPDGILKEHLHVRASAGLFDVSHMGQILVRPKSRELQDAAEALERLLPIDLAGLAGSRQRYALLTTDEGGIFDDLMVANLGDAFLLVVNAARRQADFGLIEETVGETCVLEDLDRGLIALQGPAAERVLSSLHPDVGLMRFMDVRSMDFQGIPAIVSRSGYTGEDGFEISVPAGSTRDIFETLLTEEGVAPIGLGARDSLRLEAGLCLYGHDIDRHTTPVEAALEWAIPSVRRNGGRRAGGFPGDSVILSQLSSGASRRRVGLRPQGKAPMREGIELFAAEPEEAIGRITSGGFGPSVDGPVSMGYVPVQQAAPGTQLLANLRGKMLPVDVVELPFIVPGYKRG
jgi:aminomethyltransferase